jgi:hypothetical protein
MSYWPAQPVGTVNALGERALADTADEEPAELTKRERGGFVYRRVVFYIMLLYFCAATMKFPMLVRYRGVWLQVSSLTLCMQITNLTFWFWAIHTLWFEVEVTYRRHSVLCSFLHGLSFCGAFDVFVLDTILLIYNPGLIAQRSQIEHLPIWVMWLLNAQLHWLPVILVCVDLYLSRSTLQRRHDWRVRPPSAFAFLQVPSRIHTRY